MAFIVVRVDLLFVLCEVGEVAAWGGRGEFVAVASCRGQP